MQEWRFLGKRWCQPTQGGGQDEDGQGNRKGGREFGLQRQRGRCWQDLGKDPGALSGGSKPCAHPAWGQGRTRAAEMVLGEGAEEQGDTGSASGPTNAGRSEEKEEKSGHPVTGQTGHHPKPGPQLL